MKGIWTVYTKELLDGIRDIRSVFITWILPLLLFPAVVGLLSIHTTQPSYLIAVKDIDTDLLKHFADDENITIIDTEDSSPLMSYSIDASVTGYINNSVRAIEITYNSSVRKSLEALEYIKAKITEYSITKAMNDNTVDDFIIVSVPGNDIHEGTSQLILFSILPILLVVMSITSPIAIASDIIAGEKERLSLELLFVSGTSRMTVILGKYLAILTFGCIGVLAFLTGAFFSIKINSQLYGISKLVLSQSQYIMIFVMVILMCSVMAAVETLISLFARSAKESQLYIIPLSIVTIGLCTFSESLYFNIVKTGSQYIYYIPVLNIVHYLREIIMKDFSLYPLFIVLCISIISVVILITLAGIISSFEKIVYRN